MLENGSQNQLNEMIPDCQYFCLIAGWDIGEYTEEEFDAAWNAYISSGKKRKPCIYPFLLRPKTENEEKDTERLTAFLTKIRNRPYQHYLRKCRELDQIKLALIMKFLTDQLFAENASLEAEEDGELYITKINKDGSKEKRKTLSTDHLSAFTKGCKNQRNTPRSQPGEGRVSSRIQTDGGFPRTRS